MPASTPAPWSIPYPVGTDRVADGDNAMQAIAERVALISNALPRGLVVTAGAGSITPGGSASLIATCASFTTTEARDLLVVINARGKLGTAGTGISFDAKRDGGAPLTNGICIFPTNAFDQDWTQASIVPANAAGSQVWTLWATGYGAVNNPLTNGRITIYDMGATGAI